MKKPDSAERLATIFESLSDVSLVLLADFFPATEAGGGLPVALALASAGVTVFPVGVVGEDEPGQQVLHQLHEHRVSTSGINRLKNYHTPSSTGPESIHGEHPALLNLIEHARKFAPASEALYVCDHGIGAASPRVLNFIKSNRCLQEKTVAARSLSRLGDFEQLTTAIASDVEMEKVIGVEIAGDAKKIAIAGTGMVSAMKLESFAAVSQNKVLVFSGAHKPTAIPLSESLSSSGIDVFGGFFAAALGTGAEVADAGQLATRLSQFFAAHSTAAKRTRREELISALG